MYSVVVEDKTSMFVVANGLDKTRAETLKDAIKEARSETRRDIHIIREERA